MHETERQAIGIEHNESTAAFDSDINKVVKNSSQGRTFSPSAQELRPTTPNRRHNQPTPSNKTYYRCGYQWPHTGNRCQAEGQTCNICSKPTNFARVCNSKEKHWIKDAVHSVRQNAQAAVPKECDSDSDETVVYAVRKPTTKEKQSFHKNVKIGNSSVRFQIDIGSTANIMDCSTYETLAKENPQLKLSKSSTRLFAYGSPRPLSIKGQFECVMETRSKITTAKIIVVERTTGCLLSGLTSLELNLLQLNVNKVDVKPAHKAETLTPYANDSKVTVSLKPLLAEYDDIFHGVGKLIDVSHKYTSIKMSSLLFHQQDAYPLQFVRKLTQN